MENRCRPRHGADRCIGSPTAWGSRISPSSMPTAVALAARCGFPLSPQLHRGIPACGPALPGAAERYGTASMLDPSRPELEFRIHLPPAVSLQTFGSWQASSASDDAKQHAAKLDKLAKEPRIPWSRPKHLVENWMV